MKKYILIIIFYSLLYSQATPYISPGLQIGVNSSGDFFTSVQITLGIISTSDGELNFPPLGATVGRRTYYNRTNNRFDSYTYIDGQVSMGVIGFGYGIISNQYEKYSKYKFFIGAIGLLSYDYISCPRSRHHFGIFGVAPIPITNDFNFQLN